MKPAAAIIRQQEQARFMCSACGADRGCDCNAPAVEKLASIREKTRQRVKRHREKVNDVNEPVTLHPASVIGPTDVIDVASDEEEASEDYQDTLYDKARSLLEEMDDETRDMFITLAANKYKKFPTIKELEDQIAKLMAENRDLLSKLEKAKEGSGRCPFVKDNGGGPENEGNCVPRSIAIATGKPYDEVVGALRAEAARFADRFPDRMESEWIRKSKKGAYNFEPHAVDPYLRAIGWEFTRPKEPMRLRADDLPSGRLIVSINRHYVAVIDGVIHDLYDSGGAGKIKVEGYYTKVAGEAAASKE